MEDVSKRKQFMAMQVGDMLTFKHGEINMYSVRTTLTQLKELTGKVWKTRKLPDRYTIERIL